MLYIRPCYLLPATCYLLPATCYLLPSTFYLLPATFYLLPATCYLLPATPLYLLLSLHLCPGEEAVPEYLAEGQTVWGPAVDEQHQDAL